MGTFTVLRDSPDTGCEKCERDQMNSLQVTGTIPLTIALLERYLARDIAGLTPDVVIPYLQKNLHWKVIVVSLEYSLTTSAHAPDRPTSDTRFCV